MAKEEDTKFPEKAPLGTYPYNQVYVWPDGREIHMNYTPGNETTRYFTAIGSGFEIDKDGRMVLSANNRHDYAKGGSTTTTDKNSDTKVGGGSRKSVDTGSHAEVGGTNTKAVKGPNVTASKGNQYNASTGGDGEETLSGDQVKKVTGSMYLAINGDNVQYVTGSLVIQVVGESSEHVKSGNKSTEVSEDYKIICKKLIIECEELQVTASGKIEMNAGSTIDMTAAGDMTLKGANIKLNP